MNPFNYSRPTGGYAVTEFSTEFQKNSRRDFTREEINEQPRSSLFSERGKKKKIPSTFKFYLLLDLSNIYLPYDGYAEEKKNVAGNRTIPRKPRREA